LIFPLFRIKNFQHSNPPFLPVTGIELRDREAWNTKESKVP